MFFIVYKRNPSAARQRDCTDYAVRLFARYFPGGTPNGLNHWSESTLSSTMHRIAHYINPYIGAIPIKSLTTHWLERFYRKLLREPAVCPKGKEHLQTTIAPSVVEKVHGTIRSALNQAIRWDYLKGPNPAITEVGSVYQDFNLVVARDNGRPFEEHNISEKLKALIQTNNLRPVVFHSLRHSSTSVKLKISGGDIKAVQGDTGHAQANMVTDVYSHIMDSSRPAAHGFLHETADSAAKKFAGDCRSASANVSHFKR